MLYIPVPVLHKYSRSELKLGLGISHGRLPEGGEHGTDGEEEEGTRAWMEALRWYKESRQVMEQVCPVPSCV